LPFESDGSFRFSSYPFFRVVFPVVPLSFPALVHHNLPPSSLSYREQLETISGFFFLFREVRPPRFKPSPSLAFMSSSSFINNPNELVPVALDKVSPPGPSCRKTAASSFTLWERTSPRVTLFLPSSKAVRPVVSVYLGRTRGIADSCPS